MKPSFLHIAPSHLTSKWPKLPGFDANLRNGAHILRCRNSAGPRADGLRIGTTAVALRLGLGVFISPKQFSFASSVDGV